MAEEDADHNGTEGKDVVGLITKVKVRGKNGEREVLALFDTGATRTSIDKRLAEELQLEKKRKKVMVKSKTVPEGYVTRGIYEAELEINGRRFRVEANVADRSNMMCPVLIGRDIIHGNFVIDVTKTHFSNKLKDIKPELREE